jgi:hypothetical protein
MDYQHFKESLTSFYQSTYDLIDQLEKDRDIHLMTRLAFEYLDKPYIWAGNDPLYGTDCSGFACFLARSMGFIPPNKDFACQGLYTKFPLIARPREGAFVYYGSGDASHMMYCLSKYLCIGAQGGNRHITTDSQAIAHRARIRVLPIHYRKDILGYNNPFNLDREGD